MTALRLALPLFLALMPTLGAAAPKVPPRCILLPFEAGTVQEPRLPRPRALLLPFREGLMARGCHLVTSVHRNLEAGLEEARREQLDLLLLPSLEVGPRRLWVRLEALDTATGRRLRRASASRPLPPGADPHQIQALLPGLADEVYRALLP